MNLNEIMQEVKKIITNKVKIRMFDYDDLLLENGVDSVSIIEILVEIEEVFGVEFDNTKLNYNLLRSIRSISQHIESLMNEGSSS